MPTKKQGCILKKCRKVGENPKGDSDPRFGLTEWEPTPAQRQPEEPPLPLHQRTIPKYLEPPDPMPAMRDWYEKAKTKQGRARSASSSDRSPTRE